jgi:hypothetical protein
VTVGIIYSVVSHHIKISFDMEDCSMITMGNLFRSASTPRIFHGTCGSDNEFAAAVFARVRLSVRNVGRQSFSAAAISVARRRAKASAYRGDGASCVDA